MTGFLHVALAATLAVPAITLGAGTAQADSDGYVADLQAAGVPMLSYAGWAPYIKSGYTACEMLRAGESPDTARGAAFSINLWGQQMLAAAQKNLCPDTLAPAASP